MSTVQSIEKQSIRVLSASVDPHLNHSRAELLRHHGFDVTTSESSEHARELIKSSSFDVLIFGSTLTREMCRELAEVFRESTSRGKIIEVIPSPLDPAKNHPDAIVVSKDESSKLVRTIRESLRESRSKNDEKWMELCSQAAVERDPNKLMKLLEELDRVLDEREKRRTLPSSSSSGDEQ